MGVIDAIINSGNAGKLSTLQTTPNKFAARNPILICWYGRSFASIIVERILEMNKQMNNVLLVGIIILLLTACGPLKTPSTPAPMVTLSPVDVTNNSTAVPATGLAPAKFSHYVGWMYPPLPTGLTEGISLMIQDSEDYGLFLFSEGEDYMLWLSKMTHQDSKGNPYWEVKDVLDLSHLEVGDVLVPDGCFLNGEPDNEILVAGRNGVMISAWRANTKLNVFEVIPTSGIECNSDKGTILN